MAGRQSSFSWDPGTLTKNMTSFKPKLDRAIIAAIEYHATRGEAYMRQTAKWRDRSTNARNGLHTATSHDSTRHTIIFAHSVPYGIWLEIRWSGRYAVIMPTITHEGSALMKTVSGLVGKLNG